MACIKCLYNNNLAYFPFFGKEGMLKTAWPVNVSNLHMSFGII